VLYQFILQNVSMGRINDNNLWMPHKFAEIWQVCECPVRISRIRPQE
jgi:hypothetical protein